MSTETSYEHAREVLARRRGVALVAFVTGAAAAVSFSAFLPDVYKATATLVVDRPDASAAEVGEAPDVEARLRALRQEVLSRGRLQQFIDEFDLYPAMRRKGVPVEIVAERMRREVNIEFGGNSAAPALKITYWSDQPARAALVSNGLARAFIEEDAGTRRQQVTGMVASLRSQLADAKARLDAQEERVGEFKRRFGAELPQQAETNLATIQRLNTLLQLAVDTQGRAWERRALLQQRQIDAARAPDRGAETPALRVSRLRQRLADLRRAYGDKYPDVVSAREELASAEAALLEAPEEPSRPSDPLASQMQQVDEEIRQAKAEERELRARLAAYQRKVENAPSREQEFQELSRDYATTRALYESLLKRSEEAQLAANPGPAAPADTLRVLDPALVPRHPVGPNRMGLALAGLVMALVISILMVALSEQVDDSLHTPEEVRAYAGVPVLVCVPRLRSGWVSRVRRLLALAPATLCAVAAAEAARRFALLDTPIASLLARGRL